MARRCSLCHQDFDLREGGGWIKFRRRPWDVEWDKTMERERITGHPPYARWFCGLHYPQALDLQHLAVDDAMRQLQDFLDAGEWG
jgi:hypothetical protein